MTRQVEGRPAAIVERAKELRREAALELVQIFRLHDSLYGISLAHVHLSYPLSLALLVILAEEDNPVSRSNITELCLFFRAMSRRFPCIMASLRMFRASGEQQGNRLSPETERLFEELEKYNWETSELWRTTSLDSVPSLEGSGQAAV